MAKPSYEEGYDAFVQALIRFSGRTQTYPQDRSEKSFANSTPPELAHLNEETLADYETPTIMGPDVYANPLAPLRPRDESALSAIFDHDKMDEIAQEIQSLLNQLYPEPCWEDEPFDFLHPHL